MTARRAERTQPRATHLSLRGRQATRSRCRTRPARTRATRPRTGRPGSRRCRSSLVVTPRCGASKAPARRKHRRVAPGSAGDVHAVHAERFVPGADGHASLSIVDAWVDARTRGARAYARSTLPLARVFVGPNGLECGGPRRATESACRSSSGRRSTRSRTRPSPRRCARASGPSPPRRPSSAARTATAGICASRSVPLQAEARWSPWPPSPSCRRSASPRTHRTARRPSSAASASPIRCDSAPSPSP